MFKSAIICSLVISMAVICRADDEEGLKEWIEFHQEMSVGICKPEEICSDKLKAMVDCKSHLDDVSDEVKERMKQMEQIHAALYDKCGAPNEADIKDYTKVDLSDISYKFILMSHCSENFKNCAKEEFQKKIEEWKKKKEAGEVTDQKSPVSEEKRKEIKECLHKAVFGN